MDTNQTEKLKALAPCPFCGEAARVRSGSGWHGVGCDTTSAGVMCFGYCHARQYLSAADATKAWNRRSAPAAGTEKDAEDRPLYSTRRDAERFRLAIALEDNAEVLYGAVLSHAPDAIEIRREFDAAIGAHTKAGSEPA